MNKLVIVLVLACGFFFSQSANAQRTRYYYYPDQDVYYNPGARTYTWNDNGHWNTGRQMPENMHVDRRAKHVTVYHQNPNVWEDHDMHRKKYGRHEDGDDRRNDRDRHHDEHHDRD